MATTENVGFEAAALTLAKALDAHSKALNDFVANSGGKPSTGSTAGAATGTGTKATGAGTKKKGPTIDDIQAAFGDYMKVGDVEVRKERKGHVVNIAGKFGAERATLIDPKHFEEALALLKAYQDGEDPFAEDGEAGEEESPV
jgi:hypothetical protein